MHTAASHECEILACHPCAGTRESLPYRSCSCDALRYALKLSGRQTNSLLPSDEVCSPLLVLPQSYGASSGPPHCGAHQRARIQLCLSQIGPCRCLQRLRVAPFWFPAERVRQETRKVPRLVMRPGKYHVLGLSQSAFQPPATPPRLPYCRHSKLTPPEGERSLAMSAHESFPITYLA